MQKAAVAIVRVSGSEALDIAGKIFRLRSKERTWNPKSHRVYFGDAVDPNGHVLDEVFRFCYSKSQQ